MNHPLLTKLNSRQQEAITAIEGPVLVIAGAGSGKTRVLTHRIAYLISQNKARPEEILAVTFTNKAANEIKERIAELLKKQSNDDGRHPGYRQLYLPWSGTFHSICAKILRRDGINIGINPNFTIYDPNDQQKVVKDILREMNIDTKKFNPRSILSNISGAKNSLITPSRYEEMSKGYFQQMVADIYPKYQRHLNENQALDFDDLIMRTIELFQTNPEILKKYQNLFKYILIDEYQDTNYAQYILTKLLAEIHKNIFVVGDDAQSIYRWRGADITNILNFEKDYKNAKVIKLEQNYRSTKTILDASNHIISLNTRQKPKKLWTDNKEGSKIMLIEAYDERQEAQIIAETIKTVGTLDDIAILYRTNAQSRVLEESMIDNHIPYRLVGNVKFYDRKEIKDILAYLRLIANPKDNVSLERIINIPKRGIGSTSIDKLKDLAQARGIPLLGALNYTNEPDFFDLFSSSTINKFDNFYKLLQEITAQLDKLDLINFLKFMLDKTKLLNDYKEQTDENINRVENIKEFINIAAKYKGQTAETSLKEFLEDISLMEEQSQTNSNENDQEEVTLMTIHSAKGLEFEYIFVTGMEENLFPHSRSYLDPEEMEEERRLAYVAFTRAKTNLYLSYTQRRYVFGSLQESMISRFIEDIPKELTETIDSYNQLGSSWEEVQDDDYAQELVQLDLKQGDRVRSPYFGVGIVECIYEDIIKVNFPKGTKELSTEYAKLEKIS